MSWLDIFALLLIGFFVYRGYKSGAILGLLDLAGILVSFLVPYILYSPLAALLRLIGVSRVNAPAFAFLGLCVAACCVYFWRVSLFYRNIDKTVKESEVNSKLGVVTGLVKGLIMAALLSTLLVVVPNRLVGERTINSSLFAVSLTKPVVGIANGAGAVFGPAIQKARGFLVVNPKGNERIDLGVKFENPRLDRDAAVKMLGLLNRERTKRDLEPLVMDDTISEVAEWYSSDMLKGGYFSHIGSDGSTPGERMKGNGIRFRVAGENIAYATTVELAHDGLMGSPPHKENILDPSFRRVGIGVAVGGRYRMMFTQDFAD